MKKSIFYSLFLLSFLVMWGCKKNGNYPGAVVSPYISIFDVKDSYRGSDVTLTSEKLFGSSKITGVVVSDHSGNNMPAGLLVIQDRRRLAELRGISINIGAAASTYVPGDSLIVNIEGGMLKRVDGILQITGLQASAITKVSSGNSIAVNQVASNLIVANPEKYESTLLVIVKGGFNPLPAPTDVLKGDKLLNDGFADLTLHTEANATFANNPAPFLANFTGIIFNTQASDKLVPQLRMRKGTDIVVLSSTVNVQPIIISGFISDVNGGDGNYEYVQFIATKDINFATTPYSVVFTNNANASVPTGYPASGWATGNMRTYKMNLTSGTVTKGSYFYVGGTAKLINGASSTSIASSNWIRSFNYTTTDGDGFGLKTGGLLANSGNASGIAVFTGTSVTLTSVPVDVLFVGASGSIYTTTPSIQGYRVGNNDWYDVTNPITLQEQPFYLSGSNKLAMTYTTADIGYFYSMGGEYNVTLGRWSKARSQTNVLLTKTSTLAEIENASSTKLK
ncbi:MAG: DUF5689 domain-containing protein [Sediminibacterium sp.]